LLSRFTGTAVWAVRRAFLLGALALAAAPHAAPAVHIALPSKTEGIAPVLRALAEQLPDAVTHPPGAFDWIASAEGVIIAVGPQALASVAGQRPTADVLALFASRVEYLPVARTWPGPGRLTAIFAEAAPRAQLQVIDALMGRRAKTVVFAPEGDSEFVSIVRAAADDVGQEVAFVPAPVDEPPGRALALAGPFRVLLATPDARVFEPERWRALFEATYRSGRAIVGYSPSMVNAGALATAYASVADTVGQAVEVVAQMRRGIVPPAQYPRRWHGMVNGAVGRSLGVSTEAMSRVEAFGK
jgi:putative ABC transport system substrate-binding protein